MLRDDFEWKPWGMLVGLRLVVTDLTTFLRSFCVVAEVSYDLPGEH